MRMVLGLGVILAFLISSFTWNYAQTDEEIYGIRIENINRTGADFYWSTSIETKGSVEYAYTKLPELYNPQSPGASQSVLISAIPLLKKTEDHFVKQHHVKIDRLDINYDPFVQYTIKSETFTGTVYSISGEFVLVDTQKLNWWQSWQYAVFAPLITLILGLIIPYIKGLFTKKIKKDIVI
jgi:hypothetical protein